MFLILIVKISAAPHTDSVGTTSVLKLQIFASGVVIGYIVTVVQTGVWGTSEIYAISLHVFLRYLALRRLYGGNRA